MPIRIRRGRRDDWEALSAFAAWPEVDGSPRRSIRMFRRTVADLGYDLYVADEDGRAVGMIAVSYARVLALGGQRATLEEIVVRPDRRGAGIGRELVEFVVRRAARRRVRRFDASASDANAERFLARTGFEPSGRRFQKPLPA
jgi:GNAT superfamily N-acetyltransferase